MTAVDFERLMSYRFSINAKGYSEQPTVRDIWAPRTGEYRCIPAPKQIATPSIIQP